MDFTKIGSFFKTAWVQVAIAAIAIVIAFIWWRGVDHGKTSSKLDQAEATIETMATVSAANDAAGEERTADALRTQDEGRELSDARTNPNDDAAERRARRLCARLRQQGVPTSAHPTCCRFEAPGGTCNTAGGV